MQTIKGLSRVQWGACTGMARHPSISALSKCDVMEVPFDPVIQRCP